MKFLIITQDLRISGTSQGIIERSFLAKLRISYPEAIIDVLYLKSHPSDDDLHLLPVNNIEMHVLDLNVPLYVKWANRIYRRLYNESLYEKHIHKIYGSYIEKVDLEKYNYYFIRTTGLDCESLLGSYYAPVLKKAYITFNEPYPYFWCSGNNKKLSKTHLNQVKSMLRVVEQSKGCIATQYLGRDLQFLYGSRKQFYSIPHQFTDEVFNIHQSSSAFVKNKKVTISYHGAIQFGRDLDELLDVYCEILNESSELKENTEFFVRCKSSEYARIKNKYNQYQNIYILESVDFQTSYYEQAVVSDINIALENGPIYCSILLGKAPLLDSVNKRFFCLSPIRSEMRDFIKFEKHIATYKNKMEIKHKFHSLINEVLKDIPFVDKICGDYFSDENFKKHLDKILNA